MRVCVCQTLFQRDTPLLFFDIHITKQGARNLWLSALANQDQTRRGWKRTCKVATSISPPNDPPRSKAVSGVFAGKKILVTDPAVFWNRRTWLRSLAAITWTWVYTIYQVCWCQGMLRFWKNHQEHYALEDVQTLCVHLLSHWTERPTGGWLLMPVPAPVPWASKELDSTNKPPSWKSQIRSPACGWKVYFCKASSLFCLFWVPIPNPYILCLFLHPSSYSDSQHVFEY